MAYRSLLVTLLGLSLTGCAVYGGGYAYDYGYPGYDRYYTTDHYHVERYPVYVAPRVYYRDGYRYDGRRYDDRRHDQRRYLPAPQPRLYGHDRRHDQGFDRDRQEPRAGHAGPGWQGRPDQAQPRGQQPRRDAQGRQAYRQGAVQQGRQGQPQQRAQQAQRDSRGAQRNDRRDWQPHLN